MVMQGIANPFRVFYPVSPICSGAQLSSRGTMPPSGVPATVTGMLALPTVTTASQGVPGTRANCRTGMP
jgi:hypothetical protein